MEESAARIKKWRDNPVSFVREVFHAEPDGWQADVLMQFPKRQRLGVKSGKGPGKTCLEAWCCWNFLATRPDPKIIATSITGDNLADNLWPEMSKWQSKSQLLKSQFEWTKTRIVHRRYAETWFMSARTWARGSDQQKQSDALAGTHADYVMYVLDEAGGIPDAVAATAEGGLASGIDCKLLIAGNPTNLEGPLYRACTTQAHLWYLKEITGDPDDPKRSTRVSKQWAQDQIDAYGRDNPWVLVNVFGKFPPSSLNTLLGPDEVEAAMNRPIHESTVQNSQKRLGVDVARFGDDRTILYPRHGLILYPCVEMRNADGPQIASRVALAKEKWNWEVCMIDDTGGFGASVIDSMIQGGLDPLPVNFSGKADDGRYVNRRAEMYFRAAEWIKRGGSLPKSPTLKRELTAPTYTYQNGKFLMEDKKMIKARLGFSPDEADAFVLTFALPELPRGDVDGIPVGSGRRAGQALSEWDPYASVRDAVAA